MTPSLATLAKRSPPVARQFYPDVRELANYGGTETPFEAGKQNHGIYGLERIYEDRAVLTPYFDCSAYCRYCFKKTRTLAGEGRRMSHDDIDRALRFIAADPRIRVVLITGGDPLLAPDLVRRICDGAVAIPHVRQIRIGTRNILFQPERLDEGVATWIASYGRLDPDDLGSSISVAVALSINHPDELTGPVVRAVRRLLDRGVLVRGQVTLLKDVNDDSATMLDLYTRFATIGLAPYYMYHCMPVVGAEHFRTSVQRGLDILADLAHLSGALAPSYVYVTPVGKHRLGPGSRLDYTQIEGQRHIRARTPYRADRFLEYTGTTELPALHEVDTDGYIISHYLDGQS